MSCGKLLFFPYHILQGTVRCFSRGEWDFLSHLYDFLFRICLEGASDQKFDIKFLISLLAKLSGFLKISLNELEA